MQVITKPSVMIVKEKHGDSHYQVLSRNDVTNVLYTLAQERLKLGYYEDDKSDQTDLFSTNKSQKQQIEDICNLPHNSQAFANELRVFMNERCFAGYEYEGWEIETFNQPTELKYD